MSDFEEVQQGQLIHLFSNLKARSSDLIKSFSKMNQNIQSDSFSILDLRSQTQRVYAGLKGLDRSLLVIPSLVLNDEDEAIQSIDFDLLSMVIYEVHFEQIVTKSIAVEFQIKGDGVFAAKKGAFAKLLYFSVLDSIESINHGEEPRIKIEFSSHTGHSKLSIHDNRGFPQGEKTIEQKMFFLLENPSVFKEETDRLVKRLNGTSSLNLLDEWVVRSFEF